MQPDDGPDVNRRAREQRGKRKPSGIPPQFPKSLHIMLSRADQDCYSHIVEWLPHGRSFVVRDRERFVKEIMPRFFKQTKYASFQRQLNLYGFQRIERKGPDHKSYYHRDFLRDSPQLVESMTRTQFRGSPVSAVGTSFTMPEMSYPQLTSPASQQLPMLQTHTMPPPSTAAAVGLPYQGNAYRNQSQPPSSTPSTSDALAQARLLVQQGSTFPTQNFTLAQANLFQGSTSPSQSLTFDALAQAHLFQQYALLTRQTTLPPQNIINTIAHVPSPIEQMNPAHTLPSINMTQHPANQTFDPHPQPARRTTRLKPPPPAPAPAPPSMELRDEPTEPDSMNEGEISNMAEFLEDVDLDTSGDTSQSHESP